MMCLSDRGFRGTNGCIKLIKSNPVIHCIPHLPFPPHPNPTLTLQLGELTESQGLGGQAHQYSSGFSLVFRAGSQGPKYYYKTQGGLYLALKKHLKSNTQSTPGKAKSLLKYKNPLLLLCNYQRIDAATFSLNTFSNLFQKQQNTSFVFHYGTFLFKFTVFFRDKKLVLTVC